MITQERKDELTAAGYYVEDMEKVWGRTFRSCYRWLNDTLTEGDLFGGQMYSEEDAWADACHHQERVNAC